MAQQNPAPANTPSANAYVPVIEMPEDSRLIVLNDNCILTIDAILSVAGIGKVLSHRGHELYTLYTTNGGTICTFEGTGLMQRTCAQIDEITRKYGTRLQELQDLPKDSRSRLEALERMVDAMWFMPSMPGAKQAAEDFAARKANLNDAPSGQDKNEQLKGVTDEDSSDLDGSESQEFTGFDDYPSSVLSHTV